MSFQHCCRKFVHCVKGHISTSTCTRSNVQIWSLPIQSAGWLDLSSDNNCTYCLWAVTTGNIILNSNTLFHLTTTHINVQSVYCKCCCVRYRLGTKNRDGTRQVWGRAKREHIRIINWTERGLNIITFLVIQIWFCEDLFQYFCFIMKKKTLKFDGAKISRKLVWTLMLWKVGKKFGGS